MDNNTNTRASKHLGDFGEGLVTYTLVRKGFEVATVDHVGADLIAQKGSVRIAVSVKARHYRAGSSETRAMEIDDKHLEKLEHFAARFNLGPVMAHVACVDDDKMIHLFMLRMSDIKQFLNRGKEGYRLMYGQKHLANSMGCAYVDYSSWSNESIGCRLFAD